MMATYARELAPDLWPEIGPLLAEHWREIAAYDDIPLDPDVERYNAMEAAGMLRCYTAREGGRLVGYAVFLLLGPLHYRSTLMAHQDVVFLLPSHRVGRTGIELVKFAEEQLRDDGAVVVYHHVKVEHPTLGRIVARRGYQQVEVIWAKRLDKEG